MKSVLLIDSVDKKGLIYKVSKILYEHNLNIEQNNEFVDTSENKFYMRSVIEGEVNSSLLDKLQNELDNAKIKLIPQKKKDIVILVTKESHCIGDLLIKYFSDKLQANIKAVISNHNVLEKLVSKFDIPFYFIDTKDLSREEHEKEMIKIIDKYNPELIVLAKYMRILTPNFVSYYKNKILNIHHSFLPAFIGANPYKQAYNRGVKIIGATAHIVTDELDEGPIIAQDIVRVDHSYSWQDMQKAGRDIETIVLSKGLDLLLEDRVFIYKNKTIIL